MGQLFDDRQLAAATRCVEAIVAAGTTQLGVEELRTAAGISKRTFHRYFPFKAQAIRPYYAAMTATFSERMGAQELRTVDSWVTAWAAVVLGPDPAFSLRLFALIKGDPEFWSVFLEAVEESERSFADSLKSAADGTTVSEAERRNADVTAVGLVAASRLALIAAVEQGVEPTDEFRRYLIAFRSPLLAEPGF